MREVGYECQLIEATLAGFADIRNSLSFKTKEQRKKQQFARLSPFQCQFREPNRLMECTRHQFDVVDEVASTVGAWTN